MNKKIYKIISILIMTLLIVSVFSANVYGVISPGDVKGDGTAGDDKIKDIGNDIITVIRNIGIVISVATILVLGIKYMMGSAEEKAEYKKTMLPYFIGALLLFSGSAIVTAIQTIGSNIA